MRQDKIDVLLTLRLTGATISTVGFYLAAFNKQILGAVLIGLGGILMAIGGS